MNVIEGGKSDKDRAQEIKKEMIEALGPLMSIMDSARLAGFNIEFNMAPGPLNKFMINVLKVTKEF